MKAKTKIAIGKPLSGRERSLANLREHAGKGRPKGALNKTTREVKEVIAQCFEDIGGIKEFGAWAKRERTEFYRMYAKLLPVQLQGAGVDGAFQIIISKEESQL